jgi:hypothetical protein
VVFALAVSGCFAPSSFAGTCGDYVQVGKDSSAMADHQSAQGSIPGAPSKPCTGPYCQSRQPAPFSAPQAPVSSPGLADQAAMTDHRRLPGTDSRFSCFLDEPTHPVQLASSIFHPPRI